MRFKAVYTRKEKTRFDEKPDDAVPLLWQGCAASCRHFGPVCSNCLLRHGTDGVGGWRAGLRAHPAPVPGGAREAGGNRWENGVSVVGKSAFAYRASDGYLKAITIETVVATRLSTHSTWREPMAKGRRGGRGQRRHRAADIPCPYCEKFCYTAGTLRQHVKHEHSDRPPAPAPAVRCSSCEKAFYTEAAMRRHVKRDHGAK